MKKMWIIVITIIILITALSFTRFEIKSEILINASVEEVWNKITDFESYNKWNSQLTYLGGKVGKGEILHLRLAAEANPYEFKPKISHFEENKTFAWLGITVIPKVFDGEHFFEITPIDNSTTLVVNREEYSGVLSLIFKQLPMMKEAPKGFEKMNAELKNYIER